MTVAHRRASIRYLLASFCASARCRFVPYWPYIPHPHGTEGLRLCATPLSMTRVQPIMLQIYVVHTQRVFFGALFNNMGRLVAPMERQCTPPHTYFSGSSV